MKAIIINEYGGSDKLIYTDVEDPLPGKDEVLIRIRVASVNPVDWKVREGRLKIFSGNKFPLFMGTELSGDVIKVGERVTGLNIGDRVFAGLSHKGGAYAELVTVNTSKVTRIPDNLSYEDAATLAVTGVTSLQAFTIHSNVKKGVEVLVNGASGGIGTYAVQIAKILGARVSAVCSERNIELVQSLGADEVIDYNKEDFRYRNEAFDVILDAAANAFFPESKKCLKKGGILIKLNLSMKSLRLSLWTRFFGLKKMKMILLKNRRSDLQWMIDHISSGEIKVIKEAILPLQKAKEAQELSESGRARGKILLKC